VATNPEQLTDAHGGSRVATPIITFGIACCVLTMALVLAVALTSIL
jgi:hypothetical protein